MNNTDPAAKNSRAHNEQPFAKVGVTDLDGLMRGKYISSAKLESALKSGAGFCDVVLGWDREDEIIDGLDLTGWHTGFPDAPVSIDPASHRLLPLENNMPFYMADFDGPYSAYCPRSILKTVCRRAADMGYIPLTGMEFEFTVFAETPDSVRDKHYQDLQPIAPGSSSYSILRTSIAHAFYEEVLETCSRMDIPLEGLHEETGAGFMEAAITAADPLTTADRAVLFKNVIKTLAQKHGLLATFMAKWTLKEQGQSGHIHISLKDKTGKAVFHDPEEEHGISKLMSHFIGGQQKLLPDFLALLAPTVNSFKRLCPGFWAPTWGSWGIDNRTVALRILNGSAKSQRIEHRVPGADCNPYFALAAVLASGLWGIENKAAPTPIASGNAYTLKPPQGMALPISLHQAADAFEKSEAAQQIFGASFTKHYAITRRAEQQRFEHSITDWELSRYLETS